ncbi:MAG: FG-GAP-like repeat-containing protein [Pseudomonadota bacterium]
MNKAEPIVSLDKFAERPAHRDPRVYIAVLAMAALAIAFWSGSRYPALNEKAMMGGDAPISGLAFDILLDIMPDSSWWWAFIANTTNWIYTNIKGMTFGVLFGAALLTALSLFRNRTFKSGFANSALGAAIGAPLGVCVNCAVPIAVGMHLGRMRLETTLSAMMASPTLNVIVVSMSFALLPLHIAVTKLMASLALVLLIVPLACRFILHRETELTKSSVGNMSQVSEPKGLTGWLARRLTPRDAGPPAEGILGNVGWYLRNFLRNLFNIALLTVPMMLLAAMLGAVIASMFDTTELAQILPRRGLFIIAASLVLVAFIAAFVPAPIALDVILTVILLNIGLQPYYGTTAVIALGSTSIYAAIVLWRVISPRTAITMYASVVGLAIMGGLVSIYIGPLEKRWQDERLKEALVSVQTLNLPAVPSAGTASSAVELAAITSAKRATETPVLAITQSSQGSMVTISQLATPATAASTLTGSEGPVFTRLSGSEIGLDDAGVITPLYEIGTYMFGSSIAAGDIDGDGWDDILTPRPATATGLSLFRNTGGTFTRQELDLGPFASREFVAVAFADWSGDGEIDLVASTRDDEVIILPNTGGDFDVDAATVITLPPRMIGMALSFADFDQDNRLDLAIGAWARLVGFEGGAGMLAKDALVYVAWNEGDGSYDLATIETTPGQTLTLLAHDFDGNGYPDIAKGDDLAPTDEILYFGENRTTLPRGSDNQPFPYVTRTTMGYTIGDWNRDLIADIYSVQIADPGQRDRDVLQNNGRYIEFCRQFGADLGWPLARVRACAADMRSIDTIRNSSDRPSLACMNLTVQREFDICSAMNYIKASMRTLDGASDQEKNELVRQCETLLAFEPRLQGLCAGLLIDTIPRGGKEEYLKYHPPIMRRTNLLFTGLDNSSFRDDGEEQGVQFPGWSWNARFTDLDQDGWEDLLVMTGIWLSPSTSKENVLYQNRQGRFRDKTNEFGLGDSTPSYAYALLDFDRDGDIDVIRPTDSLSMVVHRNDRPSGKALWISLRDGKGNSAAIGSSVTICTNGATRVSAGKCQRRWIHAGGGYKSIDPSAAHFGLGSANQVSLIEVVWPDGEVSTLRPEALADGDIRIERR